MELVITNTCENNLCSNLSDRVDGLRLDNGVVLRGGIRRMALTGGACLKRGAVVGQDPALKQKYAPEQHVP
jgi:hypothetical protein